MSAPPQHATVPILQEKCVNLALLNQFIEKVQPAWKRKAAIMALWEAECISENACKLLIEFHQLEAA